MNANVFPTLSTYALVICFFILTPESHGQATQEWEYTTRSNVTTTYTSLHAAEMAMREDYPMIGSFLERIVTGEHALEGNITQIQLGAALIGNYKELCSVAVQVLTPSQVRSLSNQSNRPSCTMTNRRLIRGSTISLD